tara:strand:- start:811 stop:933 length:123 start_codon:yes stop_codon:yes gene_type:complete
MPPPIPIMPDKMDVKKAATIKVIDSNIEVNLTLPELKIVL